MSFTTFECYILSNIISLLLIQPSAFVSSMLYRALSHKQENYNK